MFERVVQLIGQANFDKLQETIVAVVGLGGVGGYAVESLIRSGIGSVIIIDYDTVDVSNLNRQIISSQTNVGTLKVDAMEERILSICPNCKVIKINKRLDSDNVEELFQYSFDYLIDACDTIVVKEELIRFCVERNIHIISCMGTGNKLDPSALAITDIWKTSYDPIAKRIRKYLRKQGINKKIPVVYSKEQNDKFDGSIPSMIFVPASAGLLCANYVIKSIINYANF